ncbi:MAG TPA: aminotransferase class I/II-fold pyridoxal phosphate-dependent enzyme, partial [Planctomycetota bacterium]|nr:aminotransferase class I/II-fold pyridoxal phosphate-dependent enzyme [Planctomycetota bacterium]
MEQRPGLEQRLASERERRAALGLAREVVEPDAHGADFTSNDVLGLARDPALVDAARAALAHGAGGRASRLLGGGSPLDREVEFAAAEWLGAEEALLFPSGYHANLGVLAALVRPGDVVLSDELNHASLIDGLRLARARVVRYRHADAEDLERQLAALGRGGAELVVTESVFSMDGDLAPLGAIADACARFRAGLVVDEAHAVGLLGPRGAGAWAALGPERARDPVLAARVVTGGKALGAAGALVVSSAAVRDALVNR